MRVLRAWEKPRSMKGFRSNTVKAAATAMGPPIAACVAHRCSRHENVKPLNLYTPEMTECGACIAEDTTKMLEIYNDVRDRLERACGALNLLSPGAGDPFQPPPIEEPDGPQEDRASGEAGSAEAQDPEPEKTPTVRPHRARKTRKRD